MSTRPPSAPAIRSIKKQHNGDLWVAATAIRWGIPLVAHDGVFLGCPGLDLRTEISAGP